MLRRAEQTAPACRISPKQVGHPELVGQRQVEHPELAGQRQVGQLAAAAKKAAEAAEAYRSRRPGANQ